MRAVSITVASLAISATLAGCGHDHPMGPPRPCVPPHGIIQIETFAVGQEDPFGAKGLVPGFDVDGLASTDEDASGCFHTDFSWPAHGGDPNVDNQLGPILGSLGSSLGIDARYAEALSDDRLQLALSIAPVSDDPLVCERDITWNDDSTLTRAVPTALSDETTITRFTAPITVPIYRGTDRIDMLVQDAQLSLTFDGREVTGVIGGVVDLDEAERVFLELLPEYADILRSLLDMNADLSPESEMFGDCQRISVAWVFTGVLGD